MRRVRYHEYGGPEVLRIEETDIPTPDAGEVLIRVEAIGANFVDTQFRRGGGSIFRRPLPWTVSGDVVGVVAAVGAGVDAALTGTRVAGLAEDAFADYVTVEAAWLAVVPAGLDDGAASMLSMVGPVARGVLRLGRVTSGDTVLVHAAGGGVGHLVVQLAKLLGAGTVIATAGSAEKLAFARSCGADVAVDYTTDDWPDRIRSAAPGGVDVVLDSIGGQTTLTGLELLAPYGRAVIYGASSGVLPTIAATTLYRLRSIAGFAIAAHRAAAPEQARADMAEVAEHFTSGRLRAAAHTRLPLDDAVEAHRLLESRVPIGRVVLVP
jgi:NADPH2:quinone reductase